MHYSKVEPNVPILQPKVHSGISRVTTHRGTTYFTQQDLQNTPLLQYKQDFGPDCVHSRHRSAGEPQV